MTIDFTAAGLPLVLRLTINRVIRDTANASVKHHGLFGKGMSFPLPHLYFQLPDPG